MAAPYGLPRPHFNYNFAAITVVLGNVPLSNYGSDGSIEFEFPSQLMESELSADGYVTYVDNTDERVRVTITVSETSGALAALQNMATRQMVASRLGQALPVLPFTFLDRITGDGVVSEAAIFLNTATPSKSKSLGTREFVIELPYARGLMQVGVNNAPTL